MAVTFADLIGVLQEFCLDIENTGGLVPDSEDGEMLAPAASDDWIDLGSTYEKAAALLAQAGHPRPVSYTL